MPVRISHRWYTGRRGSDEMVGQLDLVNHKDPVAKAAFKMLLEEAAPVTITALSEHTGSDPVAVRRILDELRLAGRVETDGDTLLGVYGLTLKPTQHRLTLRGSTYFTWCAFDIVGIPAALGESAEVASECAQCHAAVRLALKDGEPPAVPILVSWLSERCDSIRDQFCPTVNFYCNSAHYEAALKDGAAPDAFLTLAQTAEMGCENWAWAR